MFKKIFKDIKLNNLILLTIAGIINAFGITVFLYPVKLYDSGISGVSMLLSQITPEYISLSLLIIVFNIPIFVYGLKKQGRVFSLYAIYTVLVYSVFAWLITDVFPIDVSFASPLAGRDLLLCALFGGVISGMGSGIAIRCGGAIDGVEVLAVIFAKRIGVSVGTFVMSFNVVLYIICGFVIQSWILPLYSIVTYFAALKTIDYIVEGIDREKAVFIITNKGEKICSSLLSEFKREITKLNAEGAYSKEEKAMIYFVINRFQIGKVKELVRSVDPSAYMSISEVAEVFSKFDDRYNGNI